MAITSSFHVSSYLWPRAWTDRQTHTHTHTNTHAYRRRVQKQFQETRHMLAIGRRTSGLKTKEQFQCTQLVISNKACNKVQICIYVVHN